jgi:universal stress protein A
VKGLLDAPVRAGIGPKLRPRIPASQPRQFKRILVPLDFSRPSLKAIPYALAISRQFGADVHLLHVTDLTQEPPPTLLTLPLVPRAEWNRRFLKRLRAITLKYRTSGKVHVLKPREGVAYEEICATARELRADLIVIATHGYTGYKHMFLGSTAERVVQHSACPVLVVRQPFRQLNGSDNPRIRTGFRLRKILTPTDFSECARVGFNYGAQLAREFKAQLRLVHVIKPHGYRLGDQYAAIDSNRSMREAADKAQKEMRLMASRASVRCSVRVIHGSPALQICNAANEDIDLIVISTHGRTGPWHLLIGSVAEDVVRYAHRPVLVIPVHGSRIAFRSRKSK